MSEGKEMKEEGRKGLLILEVRGRRLGLPFLEVIMIFGGCGYG